MAESQIVEVPGVGSVEFPDSMSDAEIVSAVKKLHLQSQIPNPKQFEKSVPGDANDNVLHPKPLFGQGVADALNKPLVDAPVLRDFTSPASILLASAGAMRSPSPSTLRGAGRLAKSVSLFHPLKVVGEGLDMMAERGERPPQPPRPVFGSGGQAPTGMGDIPQTGGPIMPPQPPVNPLAGRSGPSGAGVPDIPITSGGPIQIPPSAPTRIPTEMSPRLAPAKAPQVNDALMSVLEQLGQNQSTNPAQKVSLPPTPGADITAAPGGYVSREPLGGPGRPKGSVGRYGGYSSGNPSTGAISEPPMAVSHEPSPVAPEQSSILQQLQASLEARTAPIASKSSREMSPIPGLSMNDLERIATLLEDPELKAKFLALRAEGQQGHIINSRMDAEAHAAANREP